MNQTQHRDGWILAAAHAPGLQQSIWRTDLWVVAECCPSNRVVTLTFCKSGQDGTGAQSYQIAFGSNETVKYLEDVLETYLQVGSGSWLGAIHYQSSADVQVWARVYSVSPDGTRSYGQIIEGIATSDMSPDDDPWDSDEQQWIYATKHTADGRFRVNVGVVNPTAVPGSYTVTIYPDEGGPFLSQDVTVPSYSMRQFTDPFASFNGGAWANASIRVVCHSAGGGGFAYASVIDNATNDAYFVRGVKRMHP